MIEACSVVNRIGIATNFILDSVQTVDFVNPESGTGFIRAVQPDIKNQEEPNLAPATRGDTSRSIDTVIVDSIINNTRDPIGTLEADLVRNFYDNTVPDIPQNDIHLPVYISISPYAINSTKDQALSNAAYVIVDSIDQTAQVRLYIIESPTAYEDLFANNEEYAYEAYKAIYVPKSFVFTYTSTRNQDVAQLFSEIYVTSGPSEDLEHQIASTTTVRMDTSADNIPLYLIKEDQLSPRKDPKENISNKIKKAYENLKPKYHPLDFSKLAEQLEERISNRGFTYVKSPDQAKNQLKQEKQRREPINRYKREDLCAVRPDGELVETELGPMYRLKFNDTLDYIGKTRIVGVRIQGKTQNKSVKGYSALAQLDALAEISGYEFFFEETNNGIILRSISGNGSQSYTIKVVDKENAENTIRYLRGNLESEKIDFETQQVVIEQTTNPQNIDAKVFKEHYVEALYTKSGQRIDGVGIVSYFKGNTNKNGGYKTVHYSDENGNTCEYQLNSNSILAVAIQSLEDSGYEVQLKKYELRKDGEIIGEGIVIEDVYKGGVSLKDHDYHSGYLIETTDEDGYVGEPIDANGNLTSLEETNVEEGQLYRIVVSQQGVYDRNEINEEITEYENNGQSDGMPENSTEEVEENYDEREESPSEETTDATE